MSMTITVRNFDSDGNKEISISEEDKNIDSLIRNCGVILSTFIKYDPVGVLTKEEEKLLERNEIHELLEETNRIPAIDFLRILKKLYFRLRGNKSKALLERIDEIRGYELSIEEQDKRIRSEMSEHFHFERSVGKLMGIVETSAKYELDIQLSIEYY